MLNLWVFRLSWGWFVVSICLLASMLLKHLMSFCVHSVLELADLTVVMDNEARYDIAGWILGIERFLYTHSKRVLAQFIYPLAASPRFDGTLDADVIEVQTNLQPDPRINFMYRGCWVETFQRRGGGDQDRAHPSEWSPAGFECGFITSHGDARRRTCACFATQPPSLRKGKPLAVFRVSAVS